MFCEINEQGEVTGISQGPQPGWTELPDDDRRILIFVNSDNEDKLRELGETVLADKVRNDNLKAAALSKFRESLLNPLNTQSLEQLRQTYLTEIENL